MRQIKLACSYVLVFVRRTFFRSQNYDRLVKNKTKILLAVVAILVLLGGCYLLQARFSRRIISEGVIGTYDDQNLPLVVTRLLSRGLIKLDAHNLPVPDLAQSWSETEGNKVFIVKLKPNLVWADGTPIISNQIAFNLPNVTVAYPDSQTIQFTLSDPYSPFPTLLTQPVFKQDSFVGTGPYYIHQILRESSFVRKLMLYPANPQGEEVVVNFYPNEHQAKDALKLGDVESILGVADKSGFAHYPNLSLTSSNNYSDLVTIFYNTSDPVLSDENLRLALSYAAPSIGGQTEAITSIPPQSWAFNSSSDVKNYLDNPFQAKAALKKVKEKLTKPIVLTATSNLADVGEKVVEAWQKFGIKAQLKVESGIPQNFQALLITHAIPADPDQYALWHSTQTQTNLSKISNPRIDKDLEEGRTSTDSAVRKADYLDFQKILLDHAPATFLYFPKYNVIFMKKDKKQILSLLATQLEDYQ